jgi:hypothetical protein
MMPIKITNRWNNRYTDVVNYKVQLSGAPGPDKDIVDEGTIEIGETREVPDEKLTGVAFKLTMIVGSEAYGMLFVQGLSKDSEVTAIVTKPYRPSGTE